MTTTRALIEAEIERQRVISLRHQDDDLLRAVFTERQAALEWVLSILPPDALSPDREPGMGWKLSAEGKQHIQDLEDAQRAGARAMLRNPPIIAEPLTAADPIPIEPGWTCRARRQSLPEPAECDWPVCGCDPAANKVIEALEENLTIPIEREGWRDIETLKPDAGQVLLGCADGRRMIWEAGIWLQHQIMDAKTPQHLTFPAIAWQPLPAPPAKPSGVGEEDHGSS